jgi:hypothetical protein
MTGLLGGAGRGGRYIAALLLSARESGSKSCPGRAVNSTTQEGAIAVPGEEVSFRSDGCTIAGAFAKAADTVAADYSNRRRGQ